MAIKTVDAEQLDADLTIVADAIRSKGGTTEQLAFPSGFKSAVENINTSREEQEKTLDVVENGEYSILPDTGKALSKANVYVNIPSDAKEEQEKSVDITENGTTEVIPDLGKVLSKVIVNAAIASGGGSAEIKEASGTFTLIEDASNYNIDIADLGWFPDLVFIQLDETNLTYDTTPTKGWVLIDFPLLNDIGIAKYAVDNKYIGKTNLSYTYRGAQGVNTLQVGANALHKVCLDVRGFDGKKVMIITRTGTGYPIIAGTYNWYAYKIWEDE